VSDVSILVPPFPVASRMPGVGAPGDLRPEEFRAIHGIEPIRGGAVSATWFAKPLLYAFDGTDSVDWDAGGTTIKVSLHTSSWTPNEDTHDYYDDVTNEVSSANYTAGGASLGSRTAAIDSTNNRVELDAADTSWSNVSFTARYAVIYKATGNAATSLLLGYVDFGADETVSSGTFSLTWDAEGILQISY